jgi:hypothetical protein
LYGRMLPLALALYLNRRKSARRRLSMKPLRGLQLSSKKLGVALLRKNLAWHTQAEGCSPPFRYAFDGANEASTFLWL